MTDIEATGDIVVEREERVQIIRLARPAKKNAITQAMYRTMANSLQTAGEDDAVRAVLIEAEGNCFSAGNDLMDFRDNPPLTPDAPVHQFLRQLASPRKPLIIAVAGPAVGVGTTMLLHADIVLADPTASFQVPFVDLALVPEAASSLLLPAQVGRALASDLFLTGRRMEADEALRAGLLSRLVAGDVRAEARAVAALVAAKPPGAVAATRGLMALDRKAVLERMQDEGELFGKSLQSAEFAEAVAAFFQGRAPRYD